MTLAEYLKLLKIDQIEDDEEFCNTEYDAIRFYFNNYKPSIDDISEINQRGYDENIFINKPIDEPIQENKHFTDEEMRILLNAIMCLIESTSNVLEMVYDDNSIEALRSALGKYRKLNNKICSYLNGSS